MPKIEDVKTRFLSILVHHFVVLAAGLIWKYTPKIDIVFLSIDDSRISLADLIYL